MNKAERMKKIYMTLPPNRKNEVRRIIEERGLASLDTSRNWIYNFTTPEEHLDEVYNIIDSIFEELINDLKAIRSKK